MKGIHKEVYSQNAHTLLQLCVGDMGVQYERNPSRGFKDLRKRDC